MFAGTVLRQVTTCVISPAPPIFIMLGKLVGAIDKRSRMSLVHAYAAKTPWAW